LGLGNDLYGDDGVGIHAVRILKEEWAAQDRTRVRKKRTGPAVQIDFAECSLSGIAILDVIRGYDALVIIDTIIRPDPATGRIHLLEMSDVRDVPGPSPHYISIPQTIALGEQLGIKMPEIMKIIAVEAKNLYSLGEPLSEGMRRRLPEIVETTKSVLTDLMKLAKRPNGLASRRISP